MLEKADHNDIVNQIPVFDRQTAWASVPISRLGSGDIGGKAHGLLKAKNLLDHLRLPESFEGLAVDIPRMVVLTTEIFDLFMQRNALLEFAETEESDTRIANAFQKAVFPDEYVGDMMALARLVQTPIAVRSSSLLEDALYRPFAGVYGTKMIPNNQHNATERFLRLIEAIKFVYASTFFREAKCYIENFANGSVKERMAVILQEVVGHRHGSRFYPEVSGVARSFNFYAMNWVHPEDGVVDLALGLGKTVVDGEATWTYCPNLPQVSPPFNTIADLLKHTQLSFWAVNMGKPPAYDPINEAEYLVRSGLEVAEEDGTLRFTASTYDHESGRIQAGVSKVGPRLMNFASILRYERVPLNNLLEFLLDSCEKQLGRPVEIEFALTIDPQEALPARFGFLQVRPIVVDNSEVTIEDDVVAAPHLLLASDNALGNGVVDTIEHIVLVRPDKFEWKHTQQIAAEIEVLNSRLIREHRNCILIGYGRWGTTDEWRGIPVHVGQISTARVIVEATLPGMTVSPSQGSHFFHNITSFRVLYFSVPHDSAPREIDWAWLASLTSVQETEFVRLLRADRALSVVVDGRSRQGVIRYG